MKVRLVRFGKKYFVPEEYAKIRQEEYNKLVDDPETTLCRYPTDHNNGYFLKDITKREIEYDKVKTWFSLPNKIKSVSYRYPNLETAISSCAIMKREWLLKIKHEYPKLKLIDMLSLPQTGIISVDGVVSPNVDIDIRKDILYVKSKVPAEGFEDWFNTEIYAKVNDGKLELIHKDDYNEVV